MGWLTYVKDISTFTEFIAFRKGHVYLNRASLSTLNDCARKEIVFSIEEHDV
jgi:hypothetical protein